MDSASATDTPYSRADAEALAEAWLVSLKYYWAFDALSLLIVTDPEYAWRVIRLLLSRATETPTLMDIGTGPLTDLLCEHAELFVERVEALAWSSAAFAQALENVWLVESDSEVARRLVRVGCQSIGMERVPPVFTS